MKQIDKKKRKLEIRRRKERKMERRKKMKLKVNKDCDKVLKKMANGTKTKGKLNIKKNNNNKTGLTKTILKKKRRKNPYNDR